MGRGEKTVFSCWNSGIAAWRPQVAFGGRGATTLALGYSGNMKRQRGGKAWGYGGMTLSL